MDHPLSALLSPLVRLLDLPDDDYWYDVGCCEATGVLNRGGEPLLRAIGEVVANWGELRNEHLAYILGDTESPLERELLLFLAKNLNQDVACRAREGLRQMPRRRV